MPMELEWTAELFHKEGKKEYMNLSIGCMDKGYRLDETGGTVIELQ